MTQLRRRLLSRLAAYGRTITLGTARFRPESASWRVSPGPFGRGNCLTELRAGGDSVIIAPPGVPLAPVEEAQALVSWRSGRWSRGRIACAPEVLTLDAVVEMAPH